MMNIQTEILKELIVSLVNRINDKKILRLIYLFASGIAK